MSTQVATPDLTPSLQRSWRAAQLLKPVVNHTPLQRHSRLSQQSQADVFLKREDLQPIRSFKIRGAFHCMMQLSSAQRSQGVVCASAGNHAQGFAYACRALSIKGTIFMPANTPQQKVDQTQYYGRGWVDIQLHGDTFDQALWQARAFENQHQAYFVHPFDDEDVIVGQSTVALEMLQDAEKPLDLVLVPIGGGGLASGVSSVIKRLSPNTQVVGVEPEGAPSFQFSKRQGRNTTLDAIDPFVDGASVQRMGELSFQLCRQWLDDHMTVNENHLCHQLIQSHNQDGLLLEPAGALTLAALSQLGTAVQGKQVACIVSGGNNDFYRFGEILKRASASSANDD